MSSMPGSGTAALSSNLLSQLGRPRSRPTCGTGSSTTPTPAPAHSSASCADSSTARPVPRICSRPSCSSRSFPLANVGADTKRERIRSVLSWLQPPAQLPEDLDTALRRPGVLNGGVGFNVQIWRQVGWLLSFIEHWWSQPEPDRQSALEQAWTFRTVVSAMPADQPGIRNALLYLAFPRTFFPIVNRDHKRAIRNAFAPVIGGPMGRTRSPSTATCSRSATSSWRASATEL